MVPLELRGEDPRGRGDALLERVGLGDRGHHYPRAAVGRRAAARRGGARVRERARSSLFADEPTGNLDAANGHNVVTLLAELNRELGTTVVLVTHEPELPHARTGVLAAARRRRESLEGRASFCRWPGARPAARKRRGLLIVAAIAIGVAALVAINSFTDNLRASVQRRGALLLGADLGLVSGRPQRARRVAARRRPRRSTRPEAGLARVVSFGAMVLRPGGGRRASRRCSRSTPRTRSTERSRRRRPASGRGSPRAAARSPSPRC